METDKPVILYGFIEVKPNYTNNPTDDREFISVNLISEIIYNSDDKTWYVYMSSNEQTRKILHPQLLGLDKV